LVLGDERDAAAGHAGGEPVQLAKYRSALEAGTDATVIAGWTREVEGQRLAAERTIAEASGHTVVTPEQIKALAGDVHEVVRKLGAADPTIKAELYRALGVRATHLPESNDVDLVAQPVACATERVGGAKRKYSYCPLAGGAGVLTGACRPPFGRDCPHVRPSPMLVSPVSCRAWSVRRPD
jgi:putative hemolysin